MGRLFKAQLEDEEGDTIWACRKCSTDLVLASNLISDEYRSGPHKAMLFKGVINVDRGELHDRAMTSGMHSIQSIYCVECSTELGWTYVHAASSENQYKIGNFILVLPDIRSRIRGGPVAEARKRKRAASVDAGAAASGSGSALDRGRSTRSSSLSSSASASASASSAAASSSRASGSGYGSQRAFFGGSGSVRMYLDEEDSDSESDESAAVAEAAEWARGGNESSESGGAARGGSYVSPAHADLMQRLRALRRILGASSMVLHMHSPPPALAPTPMPGGAPAPPSLSPPTHPPPSLPRMDPASAAASAAASSQSAASAPAAPSTAGSGSSDASRRARDRER